MRHVVVMCLCLMGWGILATAARAQVDDVAASVCADVSLLMAQNKTPYDLALGGGSLQAGTASSTLSDESYADFWSFQLGSDSPLQLTFDTVSGAALEFALFKGMDALEAYRPVVQGEAYSVEATSGVYTLVVRRVHVADDDAASYTLSLNAASLQEAISPEITQGSGRPYAAQPRREAGILSLDVTGTAYRFHPAAILRVNDQRQDGSQVYFPNATLTNQTAYSLYTGAWTQNIGLLGGDLAINNGTDRIFFLENFAFEDTLVGGQGTLLQNDVTFADDTTLNIDSPDIYGLWITNDCTGIKLKDGRSFVAATAPQSREIAISGSLDAFTLTLNALTPQNEVVPHRVAMSWVNVREGAQVSLLNSVLSLPLVGERELSLQSTDIRLESQPPGENFPGRFDAILADVGTQVTLDWYNLRVLRLADDLINLEFLDAPRGQTTRPGANVQLFEALSDVIRIVYQPQEEVAGEERLLLPAEESYLEIITPPGDPTFDGRALPDQDGFAARSLNNLGGECYSVTNILPQANCPPNGTPNAANGNVWVALTDVLAHGAWMDLAVTRSFNSRGTRWTGPFGQGWTTAYLLDYNVAYDEAANSRPITTENNYRVALDVRYAPRGLLTFTSASGSQHPFVRYEPNTPQGLTETYRAITMPGWVLTRASTRSPWELVQTDGLTYQFDRAGRLLRYGYPSAGRMIEITYPRTTLNGMGDLGLTNPVFITDASGTDTPLRRLELYYNADHYIVRSVLRDMSQGEPASLADCQPKNNCFETLYVYEDEHLTEVLYPDGQLARYSYDEAGRLIEQLDPYAPLATRTTYTYGANGDIVSITLAAGEETLVWRTLAYEELDRERRVTITDEMGHTRTLVYTRLPDSLRRSSQDGSWQGVNKTTYVLVSETSPLAGADAYESNPQTYTWEDGLLTQANTRPGARQSDGRLSYDFNYTPTGKLSCISCDFQGLPQLRVGFPDGIDPRDPRVPPQAFLVSSLAFTDGSVVSYEYDGLGFVTSMTDRMGATYRYTWSLAQPIVLERMERENDGMIWEYSYNALGLLTRSIERLPNENAASAYTISYTWDALGRLTGVSDTQIGAYTLTYGLPTEDETGRFVVEMTLTDPIGAQTVRRYDTAGRLLESRLEDVSGVLRRETYAYDLLGRLTQEARWIADGEDEDRPLPTRYTYSAQPTIDVTGLVPEGGLVTINGTRIEMLDAAGTQRVFVYDALGRLRETYDETARRVYYDYSTADTRSNYGLRITQYEKLSGIAAVNINTFRFDSRWQLIGIERGAERWELTYADGISTRLRSLDSTIGNRTVTLQEVAWNWDSGAFPQNVQLTQAPIALNSRFALDASSTPSLQFNYDFLGRPLRLVDGAEVNHPLAYCAQPGGRLLTIYGLPDAETVACDSSDYQAAVVTDKHNRLVEYRDGFGTRTLTYLTDTVSTAAWVVEVQMVDGGGQGFSWLLRYNAAGDLTSWLDETGIVRSYEYDAIGRLTAVTVEGQPEASFTFAYNDANNLTAMYDGLGRGTLYNYNETEQVIGQLDANTADAVSYSYTPTGQLAALISPEGNAATFLYEDPTNPARPTAVIDPTGDQHRFLWDDSTNTLVYTNPLNEVTRYRFDGTGLLWRIDDPLQVASGVSRSHEIHYDSDGRLTEWLYDVRQGAPTQQKLTVAHESLNTWAVSESQGETNWSQSLTFAPSGELLQAGEVRFEYDPLSRLRQITAGDQLWTLEWAAGAPEVVVNDPFGLQTLTRYDALSRVLSDTVNDTSTSYTYTPDETLNQVTLDVDRPGVGQRRYVLSPGNVREGTPPTITLLAYGQRTQYIYNGEGLLTDIVHDICTDASYATWEACEDNDVPGWTTRLQFVYDADQRPIRIVDQDGNARTFAYDAADNLLTYQTASGRTYTYSYDAAQHLTSLTSATGVKLLLGYDARDNLLGICRARFGFVGDYAVCVEQAALTDGSGLLESYGYDTLNRLIRRTFPNGADNTTDVPYEYDETGSLTRMGAMRYAYNALDLLENRYTDGTTYTYRYHALNQLAEAGDLRFVYDDTGRVRSYTSGGQTFGLIYSEDNVYTIQDENGHRLEYGLDARGILNKLSYDGQDIVTFEYAYDEREPGINLLWNDDNATTITSSINRRKQTLNQAFVGAGDFTVFYEITPTGLVQRQDITALPGRREGYIVVQGYDNDERPLTMRVTDAAGLQVLYTQTITYNTVGLRTGEQLQYADGTRVIKTLTYQNNSQLISQSVLIIRPLPVAAAVGLLPLLWLRRRRGRLLVAALLLGLVALPLLQAQTPQIEERYQFTYTYDPDGNMQQLDLVSPALQTCATYAYDAANRLTRIQRGDVTASYEYDAYDRVTRLTDASGTLNISYQGTSERILSVQNDTQTYVLQTAQQPAFAALDAAGTVTWLISDGRERLSQTYQEGDDPQKDLWLFDPLGRVLTLQAPAAGEDLNPCRFSGTHDVAETVRLQSDPKGIVWDAAADVYFFQGRAYDAELGRYIQRDPYGPDALGNIYDGWTRQTVPLTRSETPVYAQGLSILRETMSTLRVNEELSADAVKRRMLPLTPETGVSVSDMMQQARQPFDETVNNLANLPLWLQSNYNLPAPGLDTLGRYTLSQASAPGQGGTRTPFTSPYDRRLPAWKTLALTSVVPSVETFTALTQSVLLPQRPGLNDYDAFGWIPQPLGLTTFLQTPDAPVVQQFTPESVLDLLPRPLSAPEQAAYTLDTVAFLQRMPARPVHEWIQDALEEALPKRPLLPVQTVEAWEQDWFSEDLLGLGRLMAQTRPPLPFLPFYQWGDNPDWLHILR